AGGARSRPAYAFSKYPYTHRVPRRELSYVSCRTPSITAATCFDSLTMMRPFGNSSARRCTLHPWPTRIVGTHRQPCFSMYARSVSIWYPVRALDLRCRRSNFLAKSFRSSYTSRYGRSIAIAIARATQSPASPLNPASRRPPSLYFQRRTSFPSHRTGTSSPPVLFTTVSFNKAHPPLLSPGFHFHYNTGWRRLSRYRFDACQRSPVEFDT